MKNMHIKIAAGDTLWQFVCEGKRTAVMIGAAIEQMEQQYGEGTPVVIVAQATDKEVTL